MAARLDVPEHGDRIGRLLEEIRSLASPPAWERVEELLRVVLGLHAAGFERILDLVSAGDTDGAGLVRRLAADQLIASLLVLHGLHPDDLPSRVQRALLGIRPQLGSHGGDVEIIETDSETGIVRLRMKGSCDGCPSSALTVKLSIERAIREVAPEVERIEVEGVPESNAAPGERCEMCAAPIAGEHAHVVNVESRSLLCTCRACHLLFTSEVAAQGRFRAVPHRHLYVPAFALGTAEWDALEIPVRIAFFFSNSSLGRVVALYPGPAGATESLLPLEAWQRIQEANPVLETLVPDVEALLVHGQRDRKRFDCFIVPIDACYELTGIVRRCWKGFDGGEEAWREIERFFDALRART